MLYFAYGMNTNRAGMAHRCPDARPLGAATLLNYSFRFAGPADVEPSDGQRVEGVLWRITQQCLASLDVLEGYPTFYNREWAWVRHQNTDVIAQVYRMQPGHANSEPSVGYLDCVLQGYRDFGVSTEQIAKVLPKYNTFWLTQNCKSAIV